MASRDVEQPGKEDLKWKIRISQEIVEILERKEKKLWLRWLPTIATVVTIFVAAGSLFGGILEFSYQQVASAHLQATQMAENAQLQATQQASNMQLQATQVAANAAQTLDQQHQTMFDTYLDQMSDLLLIYHLQASKQGSPVRAIAEARTLTTLHDLDPSRRADLVHFLWKAGLVTENQPVISLNAAPLSSTMFQHALLMNINLSGALLIRSSFVDCNLQGALFKAAVLFGVTLNNVNLSGANMAKANMHGVTLEDVTLIGANMTQADLSWAILSGDDLTKVNLKGAILAGANLKGAKITPAQLKQVASLQGTIMPDGSKHS